MKKVFFLLALIFFASTTVLVWPNVMRPSGVPPHFDWPDEMMHAFFAERFAQTGSFSSPTIPAPHDIVRPRSFNVLHTQLVPGGFLGLSLLYGVGVLLFGLTASLFFTPLLALCGLAAFFVLVRTVFGQRTALFATVLAAFHPAFWYYTAYSYLPNVPFVALLLIGFAIVVGGSERRRGGALRQFFFFAGGFSIGVALTIRTNEVLWVFLLLLVLVCATKKARQFRVWVPVLLGIVFPFLPILWFQHKTFGNALLSGYTRFAEVLSAPTEFSGTATGPLAIAFRALTLPYGFHPRLIWDNLWHSWLLVAPWASVPLLVGVLFWIGRRRMVRAEVVWVCAAVVAMGSLAVSYGSWQIADPLTRLLNTIGVSHVRYWIPFVFFLTPFLAQLLVWVWEKGRGWRIGIVAGCVLYVVLSARLVFFSAPESLVSVHQRIRAYNNAAAFIVTHTEPDAVIVTDRTDKEVFPDRAVTPGFSERWTTLERAEVDGVLEVALSRPVYAYLPAGEKPIADLHTRLFGAWMSREELFSFVGEPRPGFSLWKLRREYAGEDKDARDNH